MDFQVCQPQKTRVLCHLKATLLFNSLKRNDSPELHNCALMFLSPEATLALEKMLPTNFTLRSLSLGYCKNIVSTTNALSKALQFNNSLMCLSLDHIGEKKSILFCIPGLPVHVFSVSYH